MSKDNDFGYKINRALTGIRQKSLIFGMSRKDNYIKLEYDHEKKIDNSAGSA